MIDEFFGVVDHKCTGKSKLNGMPSIPFAKRAVSKSGTATAYRKFVKQISFYGGRFFVCVNGRRTYFRGDPLELRLIIARIRDKKTNEALSTWYLLTRSLVGNDCSLVSLALGDRNLFQVDIESLHGAKATNGSIGSRSRANRLSPDKTWPSGKADS